MVAEPPVGLRAVPRGGCVTPADRWWKAADLVPMPWRNGGGSTYELAREPADGSLGDFDWRVSLAEVAVAGPFSRFPGVDRVIALLDGATMTLRSDGVAVALRPWQPFAFPGESETWCEVPDGPTRDLNVMTRRGVVQATMAVIVPPAQIPAAWRTVLVALDGAPEVEGRVLERMDGGVRSARPSTVIGSGLLAVVSLSPAPA